MPRLKKPYKVVRKGKIDIPNTQIMIAHFAGKVQGIQLKVTGLN